MQPGVIRRPRTHANRNALIAFAVIAVLGSSFFSDVFFKSPETPNLNSAGSLASEYKASWLSGKFSRRSSENDDDGAAEFETASALEELKQLKLVTEDAGFSTTAAHCSLSTMNEKAWEGAMCSFKNLCYHPKTDEFIFHRAIPEIAPPPHPVNLGKRTAFEPKVAESGLPLPRYETKSDETWILMEMDGNSVSRLENFLRDDLFAWWLLAQHATWSDQRTVIRPLATKSSPALTPLMYRWYKAMPFGPLRSLNQFASLEHPVCFPKLVAGLGSMTDHCLAEDHDFHELKKPKMGVGVEAIPCATGRGPLFYRVREEMIARVLGKSQLAVSMSRRSPSESQVILFAESRDSRYFEEAAAQAKRRFPNAIIKRECTECLGPQDQMLLAFTASVLVMKNVGPQSLIGHFLKRGAGVVLVEEAPYAHTNFGLWNNLAYVRARWVQKSEDLMNAIQIELEKAENFM